MGAAKKQLTLEQRIAHIEMLLKLIGGFSGVTLVGVLVFAFWLGGINSKVSASSDTINRVHGVVLESKDSLQTRTGVIENRLNTIDARLASMEANLSRLVREETSVKIRPVPGPEDR